MRFRLCVESLDGRFTPSAAAVELPLPDPTTPSDPGGEPPTVPGTPSDPGDPTDPKNPLPPPSSPPPQ